MKRRDFVRTVAMAGASVMLPWDVRAAPPPPGGWKARLDEGWRRSPRYVSGAVPRPVAATHVRAAVVAHGRVVAHLDERAPKFRIRGSAPPDAREPFRHG